MILRTISHCFIWSSSPHCCSDVRVPDQYSILCNAIQYKGSVQYSPVQPYLLQCSPVQCSDWEYTVVVFFSFYPIPHFVGTGSFRKIRVIGLQWFWSVPCTTLNKVSLVVFVFKLNAIFSLTAVRVVIHVGGHAWGLRGEHFKEIISNPGSRIKNTWSIEEDKIGLDDAICDNEGECMT